MPSFVLFCSFFYFTYLDLAHSANEYRRLGEKEVKRETKRRFAPHTSLLSSSLWFWYVASCIIFKVPHGPQFSFGLISYTYQKVFFFGNFFDLLLLCVYSSYFFWCSLHLLNVFWCTVLCLIYIFLFLPPPAPPSFIPLPSSPFLFPGFPRPSLALSSLPF